MIDYIFWPKQLNSKQAREKNDLVAISIRLQDTDYMVLDILPRVLFKETVQNLLSSPYNIIGERIDYQWIFNIDDKYQVIEFEAPNLNLMQFFSLDPISLILPEKQEKNTQMSNIERLMRHEKYLGENTVKLRQSINLINLFYTHLSAFYQKYPKLNTRQHPSYNFNKIFMWYKSTSFNKMLCQILYHCIVGICFITGNISKMINKSFFFLLSMSVTIRQIDLRCQQFSYFPVQYLRINRNRIIREALPRFRDSNEASKDLRSDLPCKFYPDYIRFYNTIWLMINDVSFGLIMGSICFENRVGISKFLHSTLTFCLYDLTKKITTSLANNPLGIKLNGELTKFFSELFLWIIEFANIFVIEPLTEELILYKIITVICGVMSFVGATFGISLMIDFFSLVSFHIFLFYHIINKLYYWQLQAMTNLYYLFRGKKKNILRNRIDFNYFELDQLLMGTLLFIIMVYLTPTMLAFYLSYTILRLLMIYLEITLESLIALLNHFPLFALLLRIKDPRRIPGGVSIDVNYERSRFTLKNNSLKVHLMFESYNLLLHQILGTYCSFGTFMRVLSGKPIFINRYELYYILYSSLPMEPMDIRSISTELKETLPN